MVSKDKEGLIFWLIVLAPEVHDKAYGPAEKYPYYAYCDPVEIISSSDIWV